MKRSISKKAQVFPVFVLVMTGLVMIFLYMKFSALTQVTDSDGKLQYIGQRQMTIFQSIQDQQRVNSFVEQSAKLAAFDSIEQVSRSCIYNTDPETAEDPNLSPCGKYVYGLWSNSEKLCIPDCKASFQSSFNDKFKSYIEQFYQSERVKLPSEYNIILNVFDDHFVLNGSSNTTVDLNILQPDDRFLVAAKPEMLGQEETGFGKTEVNGLNAPGANSAQGAAILDFMTGNVIINKDEQDEFDAISGFSISRPKTQTPKWYKSTMRPLGKYSFKTAFSVDVKKSLNDPLKEIKTWLEQTWNTCQDDPETCLDLRMDAFNKVSQNYKLSFADRCEETPAFYNLLEFTEDCLSNGKYKCSCEFDASALRSDKEINILFDTKENTASLLSKQDDGTFKKGETYKFYFGSIIKKDSQSKRYALYKLTFNNETRLESAKLSFFNAESEWHSTSAEGFGDYKKIILSKPEKSKEASFSDTALTACQYRKDKFRLCARPIGENRASLFDVRFAFQLKDRPPEALGSGSVTIVEVDPCMDSELSKITNVNGVNLLSMVPGGSLISIADVLSSISDKKDSSLQVVLDAPKSPDIVGYEVYCSDAASDLLPDELKKLQPSNFIAMANSQLGGARSQLDGFVDDNPYSKFLDGASCDVPVSKPDGETIKVPAIKGVMDENGKITFNINKCGSLPVSLTKANPIDYFNQYCISVVPVDKNGQKMTDKVISNCAKMNSIRDLVIHQLIKQYPAFALIPQEYFQKFLQTSIQLPCPGAVSDMMDAKKAFDMFSLQSSGGAGLPSSVQGAISNAINKEIAGTAFVKTVKEMQNAWQKQATLTSVANQISNPDGRKLFDSLMNGNAGNEVKDQVIDRSVDLIENERAQRIIMALVNDEAVEDIAMDEASETLSKELKSEQQRADMLELINEKNPEDLAAKIMSKAAEKKCGGTTPSVETALNCLDDKEVSVIYAEYTSSSSSSNAGDLIERGLDRLPEGKSTETLKKIANKDYRGVAADAISEEVEKWPDDKKTAFVKDILQGKTPMEAAQEAIVEEIPGVNPDYITNALKNGNINSLIKSGLESEINKKTNGFFSEACKADSPPAASS